MSKFEDLIERVEDWAEQKGIHEGAWLPQYGKFTEESSEMFDELIAMDYEVYAEPELTNSRSLAMCWTLIILAQRVGLELDRKSGNRNRENQPAHRAVNQRTV